MTDAREILTELLEDARREQVAANVAIQDATDTTDAAFSHGVYNAHAGWVYRIQRALAALGPEF